MLERRKLNKLSDYFLELNKRAERGVYFCRINGYSREIEDFIGSYYETARKEGVVIEGKIPNPDEKNLAYYSEIMGMDFQLSTGFITSALKKWLPRMNDHQRQNVAFSIYDSLDNLRKKGKTENMLKNAYIKYMCWLYYKFERIVNQLGNDTLPKLLYEGDISSYELMLISILSNAGCDVVLLQYHGDEAYLRADAMSELSEALQLPGMQAWPGDFSLKKLQDRAKRDQANERLYGILPQLSNCTNAWIKGEGLEDIRTGVTIRGKDPKFFYNCFCRINGAQDRLLYANELFRLQQELRNAGRHLVIVNEEIPRPEPEEISGIKRGNYSSPDQLIMDLAANLSFVQGAELKHIVHKCFVDILLGESKKEGSNLNRLTNKAVYLLCWLKRYYSGLLAGWKIPDIGCFIYMGGCKNDNEAMFLSFLARLPVDVLILCPNLNSRCCLKDELLYELNYEESLSISKYPEEFSRVKMGTAAYQAERDLDTLMYQDTGMYRNQQYGKANVINLQTMYEEIRILWDQELKYRPGFSTVDGIVNIPVVFSKISGVKDGILAAYWMSIKELMVEDTTLITSAPYISSAAFNPMKSCAVEFFKNGKLLRNKIKEHKSYPYGILREDMQDFMLDRLQFMIEQKLIRGIGENGTEYTVIAQVLNLPKDIVRQIQKFDFTKRNPKLVYVNATETVISLEDSILTLFLNLIGFDVIYFVPTGYQCIEKYFNGKLMEEHQIGEYKYDLQVPDIRHYSVSSEHFSLKDILFRR